MECLLNSLDPIVENVIEITWMFDCLMEQGKIESWGNLVEQLCGSSEIKLIIQNLAEEFERTYHYVDWEETDLDYVSEISDFAEKRLIELFGVKHE